MAKQDVIDAINATIVENGQKGITADSLRNLLIMMTENTGEGGGSGNGDAVGGVKIYALDPLALSELGVTEITPDTWAEIKTAMDAEMPGFSTSHFADVMDKSFTANAAAFQTLIEKAQNYESTYCIIDMGELMAAMAVLEMPEYEDVKYSAGILSSCIAVDMVGFEQFVEIIPHSMDAIMGDRSAADMMLTLFHDGGYSWSPAFSEESGE